jgi:hypothetical protein
VGAFDVIWHISNLFLPALLLGAVAASLAKLVWRKELAAVGWRRLAGPAAAASACTVVVGLLFFGRDGKMATYGAMVLACALTLWWQGFGPGRRQQR